MLLKNGWTPGQYTLFRVLLGLYLFVHLAALVPWGGELFSDRGALPAATASPQAHAFPNVLAFFDSPALVTGLLLGGAFLAVCLTAGIHDRWAAVGLWYLWACLFGRNPLIGNPSLPFVGWLLLAHALVPRRRDAEGSGPLPGAVYGAAWVVMALAYSYSGITKLTSPSWLDGTAVAWVLENPLARPGPARDLALLLPAAMLQMCSYGVLALEALFAPLALSRRLRPWLWAVMVSLHLSLIALIDFADLSLGMVMMHAFTFDPAWIAPRKAAGPETVFFDGGCGLCHRAVRFVLAEDAAGTFVFAPLGGALFRASVSKDTGRRLPDSMVVRTPDGTLLTRWSATRHVLAGLGGLWRVLAAVAGLVPVKLGDRLYAAVARRRRLLRRPAEACPRVPPSLRWRFEA